MMHEYEERLKMQGIDEELYFTYAGVTKEKVKEDMKKEAEARVKYRYLLEAIVKEEKIEIADKEAKEELKKMADTYKMTEEELLKEFNDSLEVLKYDLAMRKAISDAEQSGICGQFYQMTFDDIELPKMISYNKNILSINDLQRILNPITEKYFASDSKLNLTDIYTEVFSLEKNEVERLMKEITKTFQVSFDTFEDAPEEDKEFLHTFSFICMLSFDVFVKKMLIEKIIDELPDNGNTKDKKHKDKPKASEEK